MLPIDPDELDASGPLTCCVTLTAEEESGVTHRLGDALRERNIETIVTDSPLEAMATLCLQERAQVARCAWGLRRSGSLALVVTDRERWESLSSLLGAVDLHLPETAVWMCDQGVAMQIRPVARPPELRLAGADGDDDDGLHPAVESFDAPPADAPPADTTWDRPGPFGETRPPGHEDRPADPEGFDPTPAPTDRPDATEAGDCPDGSSVSAEELAMLLRERRDEERS